MGWLLWAMDWRGFSRFDLPLIARVVLNNAGDVQAVEAAVIQASQHCILIIGFDGGFATSTLI